MKRLALKSLITAAAIFAVSAFAAEATVTVTSGGISGNLNISGGTLSGGDLSVGGFLFSPVNETGGSGDGNCSLFGGKCIQLNSTATTTMTTDPEGGMFNLNALSFVLDGSPSELGIFNVTLAASTLVVSADVAGSSCTSSATSFCVAKNEWYTLNFGGALDGVTKLVFDNIGTGNLRIGALDVTAAVPLPAAGFLLIGALGGLGLMRKRKSA